MKNKSILLTALAIVTFATCTFAQTVSSGQHATLFLENKGQVRDLEGNAAPQVLYTLERGDAQIYLLETGVAWQFNRMHYPDGYAELVVAHGSTREQRGQLKELQKQMRLETYRMDMTLVGANPAPRVTAEERSHDYINYYGYNVLEVYHYGTVRYHDIYPGIDWVIYTTPAGMKHDFVVQPGADPSQIGMRFSHHEELYIDASGRLVQGNRMGQFIENAPVSFQNGKEVKTSFALEGDVLKFQLDDYNPSLPLTIDPHRVWATYYGGGGWEWAKSCATDENGSVYMAGWTESTGLGSGGHQVTYGGGGSDAFLVKFNSAGVREWATYYGGSSEGNSCTTDGDGNIYLAGFTSAVANIASGGHQDTLGGNADAFLVKFNAAGVRQWATYYGGIEDDHGYSCTTDGNGNVYLAGETASSTNIASGGHQDTFSGADAFLVKFDENGVRQWGTYYGGDGIETGRSCATDDNGNVYLAGGVESGTTIIASGGHQNTPSGFADAWLVKFNTGGVRQWATYYGGSSSEDGYSTATDGDGNVYLAGYTYSSDNIASGGHQNTRNGDDAFLVKFNTNGVRQWGTYYGGEATEYAWSCATDENGNVYLAGESNSYNDIASGGFQNEMTVGVGPDAFLVKFNAAGVRQWGTYYGGTGTNEGWSCAPDGNGNVYLAGRTSSSNYIAGSTTGAHQPNRGGGFDAFLVKFDSVMFVGINEFLQEDQLAVYPNPTTGKIYVKADAGLIGSAYAIYDHLGKAVLSGMMDSTNKEIDLGTLPAGIYIFQTQEGVRQTFKMLKQ